MKLFGSAAALVALFATSAVTAPQKRAPVRRAAPAVARPAAKPAAPAVYYDFKGARLGMSIAEWKALPFPGKPENSKDYGSNTAPNIQPTCKTDPGGDKVLAFLTSAETAAGVVICQYGYPYSIGTYQSWKAAYVSVGEHITDRVDYKFLDGKLYEISITGSENLLSDVLEGLTAKFGQATETVNDTTQNKAGATFPHVVKTWRNPAASVRVETPWSRIDDMNVRYDDNAALSRLLAAEKAAHPDAEKM